MSNLLGIIISYLYDIIYEFCIDEHIYTIIPLNYFYIFSIKKS
jgi:hypothetical protein